MPTVSCVGKSDLIGARFNFAMVTGAENLFRTRVYLLGAPDTLLDAAWLP
jgi:hypothetical protein